MSTEISHDRDAHRFILTIDGNTAGKLDYTRGGGVVSITHTFTDPGHRGEGIAGRLTEHAVDELSAEFGEPINPACPFVASWFTKNADKQHLLAT